MQRRPDTWCARKVDFTVEAPEYRGEGLAVSVPVRDTIDSAERANAGIAFGTHDHPVTGTQTRVVEHEIAANLP